MAETFNPKRFYRIQAKDSPARFGILRGYDATLDLGGGLTIEIGRFSMGVIAHILVFPGTRDSNDKGPIISIGAFCETGVESLIIAGGEHRNESLFNFTLGKHGEAFRLQMRPEDTALANPLIRGTLRIGNGVILSTRSTVLGNADIGDGAVIGAGAVVNSECEPLSIYAGVPARKIRDRFDDEAKRKYIAARLPDVAAHALIVAPTVLRDFQQDKIGIDEVRKRLPLLSAKPRLMMKSSIAAHNKIGIFHITGFKIGDDTITDEKIVGGLKTYFAQAQTNSQTVAWTPDIFFTKGLIGLQKDD